MKKLSILFSGLFIFAPLFLSQSVKAAPTFTYPSYDVSIVINKDSTFTVRETMVLSFYGDVHGVRRDIKTDNVSCKLANQFTCGGFDRLEMLGVYDENDKPVTDYTAQNYTDEDTEDEYYRIERVLYPSGKQYDGEKVKWSVEYKVYGGLGWFDDAAVFYWNVLPENTGGRVDKSTINIELPRDTSYKSSSFQIYDTYGRNPTISAVANKITLAMRNLGSYGGLTVSYEFQQDEITKPATINYNIQNPPFGNNIKLNGVELDANTSTGTLNNIPAGEAQIVFSHGGYKDYVFNGTLAAGEVKDINVNLETETWMSFLLLLNTLITCLGIFFVPAALVYLYINYRRKGVDENMQKTIIPLFEPPADVPPYLLGTIKDETVDKEDIIGSIIDLAYRGYIKVKEITKGSDYELTKLEGKAGDPGLSPMEQEIMESVFKGKDVVTTSKMQGYFYYKYELLKNHIYTEVVSKGFFKKSPEYIRMSYMGCGIFLFIFALVFSCFLSIFGTGFLGYLVICTPLLGALTLGFGYIIAAKFMPAKTAKGSKVYADILGFRMYLNTAERFTLQNLEPKDFEKYLSYAIVFGIERQWAEKFKDIYKGSPDWYEGSRPDVWDALWVSSFTRSFADSTTINMSPASTSGSSGGGWSGGGGGFSGGGGGGGGGGSSGGF